MIPNTETISVNGSTVTLQRMHQDIGCGSLLIGEGVKIGFGVVIDLTADVILSGFVEIQDGVRIWTHRHHWRHSRGPRREIQKISASKLVIGEDVFIGTGAMLIGVEVIGDGAIIGAGAVVRIKAIAPYEVWEGNPAVFHGFRKAL